MTRRATTLRAALVALAVLLPISLSSVPCAGVADATEATAETRYANKTFRLVNAERTERGVAPLRRSACLNRFAVSHARRMAAQHEIFHQSLHRVARACGLNAAAENVAYDSRGSAAMVTAWMRSTGHRQNILNRKLKLVGAGAARGDDGLWYVAHVFGRKA